MVGEERIELSWCYHHTILSRARLPIPPLALLKPYCTKTIPISASICKKKTLPYPISKHHQTNPNQPNPQTKLKLITKT